MVLRYLKEEIQERQWLKNTINVAAGNLTFERYMEFEEVGMFLKNNMALMNSLVTYQHNDVCFFLFFFLI
jgi:menaquinone-dependent protoporphyrinogen IX oxidase